MSGVYSCVKPSRNWRLIRFENSCLLLVVNKDLYISFFYFFLNLLVYLVYRRRKLIKMCSVNYCLILHIWSGL